MSVNKAIILLTSFNTNKKRKNMKLIPKTNSKLIYHPPISESTANSICSDTKRIMQEKLENLFAYSTDSFIASNIGKEDSVNLASQTWKKISEQGKSSRILLGHNHPSSSKLSEGDMINALKQNVSDILAVTPEGKCHIMTLPILNKAQKIKLQTNAFIQIYKTVFSGIFILPVIINNKKKLDKCNEFFRNGMEKVFEKKGAIFTEIDKKDLFNFLTKQISK